VKEKSTELVATSSPTWEALEAFALQSMQQFLQRMLEEEVDGLLGAAGMSRVAVDAVAGHRNGFGKPRRLSLSSRTITLRRPRVRGLSERFESRLLPAFKRRAEEVGQLLPELARAGPGRFRSRVTRVAGQRGAAVGAVDRTAEGRLAGRVRTLEDARGGRPRGRLPVHRQNRIRRPSG
jgi:hypothetical protein